jgi:uncharacterized protein YuzB (UPF0349 family)
LAAVPYAIVVPSNHFGKQIMGAFQKLDCDQLPNLDNLTHSCSSNCKMTRQSVFSALSVGVPAVSVTPPN